MSKPNGEAYNSRLLDAIHSNSLTSVLLALRRKPNVDATLRRRGTAELILQEACFASPEILIAVLQYGADVTKLNPDGSSVLSSVAFSTDPLSRKRTDILLAAGARLTDKDRLHLKSFKETHGFDLKTLFHIEKLGSAGFPFPTPESLQEQYDLTLDMKKRVQHIQEKSAEVTVKQPEHQGLLATPPAKDRTHRRISVATAYSKGL